MPEENKAEQPASEEKKTPPPSSEEIEKAVEAIYAYAAALLREGKSPRQVEDALVEKGIERKTAAIVVDKLEAAQDTTVANAKKEQGAKNMMIGGLICIVGIVITVATYSAASGGGKYVIAWGAIIFGAVRFFQGLAQSSGN